MTLSALHKKYLTDLASIYPELEIESIFYIVLEQILSMSRIQFHQHHNKNTSDEDEKKILLALARLKKSEPIQYILGSASFYELDFIVNQSVLIPRQETEYLVYLMAQRLPKEEPLRLIDLCTGSACIAISLATNFSNLKIDALDFSEKAIQVARTNVLKHEANVHLILDDLLHPKIVYESYDVIVSNPPYVRNSEKAFMHNNVLKYEPNSALFVEDEEPLIFYNAIVDFADKQLKPGGRIFLEINEFLSVEMQNLFKQRSFADVEIVKDLDGKDRFLFTKKEA